MGGGLNVPTRSLLFINSITQNVKNRDIDIFKKKVRDRGKMLSEFKTTYS